MKRTLATPSARLLVAILATCACGSPQMPKTVEPEWLGRPPWTGPKCAPEARLFATIPGSSFRGVVVPREYFDELSESARQYGAESFWSPSPTEVLAAEKHVRLAIAAAEANPTTVLGQLSLTPDQLRLFTTGVKKLAENFDSYDAQYAGLIVSGHRRILCNFIDNDPRFVSMLRLCKWVVVQDGGQSLWQIEYDLESGAFLNLRWNGEA